MKWTWLPAAVLLLLAASQEASGVDLTKIDRTIVKEPAYQAKPIYCLLVFGPEAKSRAWVVIDGDALYVDRNCNGDLTEEGDRFAIKKVWALNLDKTKPGKWIPGDDVPVPITEPGGTKHVVTFRRTTTGIGLGAKSLGGQFVGSSYRDDLVFSDRPQTAPIVHLNAPFTFVLANAPQKWAPGENAEFVVLFGTPGLGKGTFAYPIRSSNLRPRAEIQFPAKITGDPPVMVKVRLAACSKPGFTGG
ncbi:hypothetical protein AYO44_14975 [Planctomycetaceae bacterium SCGC AG-212-F19]|nr:hypothetical protein AYO44_14975 [Planctomycetaceae bacterium SCGC AG-212-F19]